MTDKPRSLKRAFASQPTMASDRALEATRAQGYHLARSHFDCPTGDLQRLTPFGGNGSDGHIVRAAWSERRAGRGLAFAGTGANGYVEVADWGTLQLTGKMKPWP